MNKMLSWFARNGVAANLLMLTIVVGGLLTISSIKMEIFPEFEADLIVVSVPYLGAAPAEVEVGVCVRIEEAIQDLEGIKKLSSTASEGVGTISLEVESGFDGRRLLEDVKSRVDAISTFPEETEKPIIREIIFRRQVINVAVSGNADEATLKILTEQIREDILAQTAVSQVQLASVRPYEISIEVSEFALRRYGLTFSEVVQAVRNSSLDLPGGSVKTSGGEILLRSKGQAYRGTEFDQIALRSRPDGTRLMLGNVARVVDGFAETDQSSRFDGKPTALLQVFSVGDENILDIAGAVHTYVEEKQARLPDGIKLTTWQDQSRIFQGRLDLMLNNGQLGFLFVFLCLALFLRIRLAFWVALGIVISFLGTFWLMPQVDTSVNMLSLFAFIVVLGIVVDDAIIVGENIYVHQQRGKDALKASIDGTREVSTPVIFAVLTSIAAFSPLLFVDGIMGKFFKVIPTIVILMLLFSLVESLLILPAHLRHGEPTHRDTPRRNIFWLFYPFYLAIFYGERWLRNVQDFVTYQLKRFINNIYAPLLEKALDWRYASVAIGFGTMLITIGIVGAGWIKFEFFPAVESEFVAAGLTMPQGTPVHVTDQIIARIEESAIQLQKELRQEAIKTYPEDDPDVIAHIMASIGEQPYAAQQQQNGGAAVGVSSAAHLGEVTLALARSEDRTIGSLEIANRWRGLVGPIPDAVKLTYVSSLFNSGESINIELSSGNYVQLQQAAAELKQKLADYPGVFDISDSFRAGKQELKLKVKPEGEVLGVTLSSLARQVRQAFYGEEAQRIQRGRDDIRVMVRYPETERQSLGDLENMRIRTPNGAEVPFSLAAQAEIGRGYSNIRRVDRRRVIAVTADVDDVKANANEILDDMTTTYLPTLLAKHPGLTYSFEGEQRNQAESMASLGSGFLAAMMVIYVLLAIPFKSYVQPLIVMSAIPFGVVGAVWGHLIMGIDLSLLSLFGIVALSGVVVNDSLVLVDFINRGRESGLHLLEVIRNAGMARFRPVLLTSLTTFAGLTPMLLEESLQAQFLIPMAVSLAFGVLFATSITLLLVPIGYFIRQDYTTLFARIFSSREEPATEPAESPAG